MTNVDFAIRYAEQGLSVIPLNYMVGFDECSCHRPDCSSKAKHPLVSNWINEATTEINKINGWWSKFPSANIGIATGAISGIIVLDVDGETGSESLKRLEHEIGELPPTWTVATGHGRHLYFRYDGRIKTNRVRFADGLDIRSDGGYVVAPPSVHATGAKYMWQGKCTIADIPDEWVDVINERKTEYRPESLPIIFAEGQRNDSLFKLGASLKRKGLCYEAIEAALNAENQKRCQPPLTEYEVDIITRQVNKLEGNDGGYLKTQIETPIEEDPQFSNGAVDLFDIKDFDLASAEHIKTGLKALDRVIGGFYMGTFSIVTGYSSNGKTKFANKIIISAIAQNYKSWVFSGEFEAAVYKYWLELSMADNKSVYKVPTDEDQPDIWKVKPDVQKQIQKWYKSKLFIYGKEENNSADAIVDAMREAVVHKGVKLLIIDNLMTVNFNCKETEVNMRQTEFADTLRKFAINYNVAVVLVAHPKKPQGVASELINRQPDMYDIAGSSNMPNMAHVILTICRTSAREKDGILNASGDGYRVPPDPYDGHILVRKERFFGSMGADIGTFFDKATSQLYTEEDTLTNQLPWIKESFIPNKIRNIEEAPF